jgi:hypothetical protein
MAFRVRFRRPVLALLAGLVLGAPQAEADDKATCSKSYESSQILKRKGELLEARRQLIACVRACPGTIQQECSTWFENLDPRIPSIVIHVESAGQDRSDVKVEMDGKLLTDKLDGRGIDVDPGPHQLKVTLEGHAPDVKDVVIHEGEKLRNLRVVFDAPPPPPTVAPTAPASDRAPAMYRPIPEYVYFLGGVTLVGAAGFAYFGLSSESERSRLETTCSPSCSDDEVTGLYRKSLFADISAGVGAAALVTGMILLIARPSVPLTSGDAALSVTPAHGGGEISASWRF